jgi:hypothetical protein
MPKFTLGTRHPIRLFLFHEIEVKDEAEAKQKAWRTACELLRELDAVGVRYDKSYESSSDDVEFVKAKSSSTIQCLVQCTSKVCKCKERNI